MSRKRPPPDWAQRSHDTNLILEVPAPEDIVLGRGNQHSNHPGNARFYEIIDAHIPQYDAATTKFEKSRVVQSIYESVSSTSRFVKKNKETKTYFVVDDSAARQKISHAIRYRKAASTQQQDIQEEQKHTENAEDSFFSDSRVSIKDSTSFIPLIGNITQPTSLEGGMMQRTVHSNGLSGVSQMSGAFGNQIDPPINQTEQLQFYNNFDQASIPIHHPVNHPDQLQLYNHFVQASVPNGFANNQPVPLEFDNSFAQASVSFDTHNSNDHRLAEFGLAMGAGPAVASAPAPPVIPPVAGGSQLDTQNRSSTDSPKSLDSDVEKFLMENFSKEGG